MNNVSGVMDFGLAGGGLMSENERIAQKNQVFSSITVKIVQKLFIFPIE